ncbi:MAG TPA: N-acetylmuramoyl-L-alanine amidase [Bacillota bacterium]
MRKIIILFFFIFLFSGIMLAADDTQQPISISSPVNPDAQLTEVDNGSPSVTPMSTNPIRIVAPGENAHLPALSSTFVGGSVPVGGKLWINGAPVPVHPGGGFLTMVNLSPGKFEIQAELQLGNDTYKVTRTVFVATPAQPTPVSPLTIEYVTPQQAQELLPGDDVNVVCKGSPGMNAFFTVKGVRKKFPMIESQVAPGGMYYGLYRIGNKDRLKQSKIKVTLINEKNQKVSKEATGTISLFQNRLPVMAETVSPDVILRAGPQLSPDNKAGYLLFPPDGTLLQITGRIGDEYRVRLTKTKTVWVSSSQVRMLPEGTTPAPVVVGAVSVRADNHSTIIRIPLGRKIPFAIDPDFEGDHVDLSFYGAFSNTDLITNPSAGIIKSIRWFQDDEETYRLRVYTIPKGWWGYDARYEGTTFVLELRTPPPVTSNDSPLAGLSIAVDAGHSPDSGAVGVTGYLEKDANLAQALNLKQKLQTKGADVIMIRKGDEGVPLGKRPQIAWQNRADILISLHNNSLPDGGNPFIKRGFGVYYFTPMSLALAKEVHTAYSEIFGPGSEFDLPDDGLYYDNLALTRTPQMPSILVESAYMIVPEEEEYLKTDGFRSACANAIISGLERYVRMMRPGITKVN